MKVGSNIRKIREFRDIKQQDIAFRLNISITSYGKIERDEVEPSLRRLNDISSILGISLISLISLNDCLFLDILNDSNQDLSANAMIEHLQQNIKTLTEEKSRLLTLLDKLISTMSEYKEESL